jgi:hypothetical protein
MNDLLNNNSIFITGIRDSGKTFITNEMLKGCNKDDVMVVIPYDEHKHFYESISNYIYLKDEYDRLAKSSRITQKIIVYDQVLFHEYIKEPHTAKIMNKMNIKKIVLSQYPDKEFFKRYRFDTLLCIRNSNNEMNIKPYVKLFEDNIGNIPSDFMEKLKETIDFEEYFSYHYIYNNDKLSVVKYKKI